MDVEMSEGAWKLANHVRGDEFQFDERLEFLNVGEKSVSLARSELRFKCNTGYSEVWREMESIRR